MALWSKYEIRPLTGSFMMMAIVGFFITAYKIYPKNLEWGFALMFLFGLMFLSSLISMSYGQEL